MCGVDPKVADWQRRYEIQRAAEIRRWGQCEEVGHHGKQCRKPRGHEHGHSAGDGITWVPDTDHPGSQAHELEKLFETCKSILQTDIELPAWVSFQGDLSRLGWELGIKWEPPEENEDA